MLCRIIWLLHGRQSAYGEAQDRQVGAEAIHQSCSGDAAQVREAPALNWMTQHRCWTFVGSKAPPACLQSCVFLRRNLKTRLNQLGRAQRSNGDQLYNKM